MSGCLLIFWCMSFQMTEVKKQSMVWISFPSHCFLKDYSLLVIHVPGQFLIQICLSLYNLKWNWREYSLGPRKKYMMPTLYFRNALVVLRASPQLPVNPLSCLESLLPFYCMWTSFTSQVGMLWNKSSACIWLTQIQQLFEVSKGCCQCGVSPLLQFVSKFISYQGVFVSSIFLFGQFSSVSACPFCILSFGKEHCMFSFP